MIKKILVCAIASLFAFPITAFAHGEMVQATPAAGSNVLTAPQDVSIEFDGKLQTIGNAVVNLITVTDNQGQVISSPTSVVEANKISTRLQLTDITGLVFVRYRIVSEDGHPVEGDYSFTVGENPIMMSAQSEESVESKNESSLNIGGIVLIIFLIIFAVGYIIKEKKDKK
jgi:methionine-rich copper-binding protein CopC